MNAPTKQQLRDEIAQLREDPFTMIEACQDNKTLFPILIRNQWYYMEKMHRDAARDLYRYAYGEEPPTYNGILNHIQNN